MTDYSKMSDFEINCSVLAFFEPEIEHMCLSVDEKSLYHCGIDGNGFHEVFIPDYCISWADAGPIIQQNAIGVMPFMKGDAEAWSLASGLLGNSTVKHPNPLRAAMIVFLMMKESENDS